MGWIIWRDLKEFYNENLKGFFVQKKGLSLWDASLEYYWPKPKPKKVKTWWDNYAESNP